MDLQPIRKLTEKYRGGLRQLAYDIDMTEANLHRCINKNRIQASDLEKIAKCLDVPVSYFFDEGPQPHGHEVKTEGDYSPASATGDVTVTVGDAVLAEQVSSLKALVAEKDQRIALLERLAGIAK